MLKCDSPFSKKFMFCQKCGTCVIFGSKINTFELFFKSVHWIFLKLYLIIGIKMWFKVTVLLWKILSYAHNGVNAKFFSPKSTFLIFSLYLFIRFSWNCTWWEALNLFTKILILPKMGKMGHFCTKNYHF